jgi:CHASE3 domain sensor protein
MPILLAPRAPQMASMDPATLAQQARAATAQLSAQQAYVLSGSKQLKDEGNKLVAASEYEAATQKYTRAKSNLADLTAGNKEAADVARACALNLSMCYLKLGRWQAAADEAGAVLKGAAAAAAAAAAAG